MDQSSADPILHNLLDLKLDGRDLTESLFYLSSVLAKLAEAISECNNRSEKFQDKLSCILPTLRPGVSILDSSQIPPRGPGGPGARGEGLIFNLPPDIYYSYTYAKNPINILTPRTIAEIDYFLVNSIRTNRAKLSNIIARMLKQSVEVINPEDILHIQSNAAFELKKLLDISFKDANQLLSILSHEYGSRND